MYKVSKKQKDGYFYLANAQNELVSKEQFIELGFSGNHKRKYALDIKLICEFLNSKK